MPKKYKNILIIKMSSLGDIIHALPSLYALRKAYPEARITWAVHPAFAGILPGKPWIDEVYLVDRKRINQLSYWREIRKDLHAHHFDLIIDLQMIAKSGLISFLSGGKKKIGYNDAREGSFLFSKPISGPHKHGHIIEQLLDVMRYLGCPADKIEFPLPDLTKEMDYQAVVSGIAEGYKRFATGIYALWYPVVLRQQIKRMIHDLEATGIRKILQIELAVLPDSDRRGMTASGMIVINPPWKLEQQMNNVLPWLHSKLVPAGTGHATVSWIVPE